MALLYKIKKDHLFLIQYSKNLKTLKNSLKKKTYDFALKLSFFLLIHVIQGKRLR